MDAKITTEQLTALQQFSYLYESELFSRYGTNDRDRTNDLMQVLLRAGQDVFGQKSPDAILSALDALEAFGYREASLDDDAPVALTATALDSDYETAELEALRKAVQATSCREGQRALMLRAVLGLSWEEIAKDTGLSVRAARSHARKAAETLTDQLLVGKLAGCGTFDKALPKAIFGLYNDADQRECLEVEGINAHVEHCAICAEPYVQMIRACTIAAAVLPPLERESYPPANEDLALQSQAQPPALDLVAPAAGEIPLTAQPVAGDHDRKYDGHGEEVTPPVSSQSKSPGDPPEGQARPAPQGEEADPLRDATDEGTPIEPLQRAGDVQVPAVPPAAAREHEARLKQTTAREDPRAEVALAGASLSEDDPTDANREHVESVQRNAADTPTVAPKQDRPDLSESIDQGYAEYRRPMGVIEAEHGRADRMGLPLFQVVSEPDATADEQYPGEHRGGLRESAIAVLAAAAALLFALVIGAGGVFPVHSRSAPEIEQAVHAAPAGQTPKRAEHARPKHVKPHKSARVTPRRSVAAPVRPVAPSRPVTPVAPSAGDGSSEFLPEERG